MATSPGQLSAEASIETWNWAGPEAIHVPTKQLDKPAEDIQIGDRPISSIQGETESTSGKAKSDNANGGEEPRSRVVRFQMDYGPMEGKPAGDLQGETFASTQDTPHQQKQTPITEKSRRSSRISAATEAAAATRKRDEEDGHLKSPHPSTKVAKLSKSAAEQEECAPADRGKKKEMTASKHASRPAMKPRDIQRKSPSAKAPAAPVTPDQKPTATTSKAPPPAKANKAKGGNSNGGEVPITEEPRRSPRNRMVIPAAATEAAAAKPKRDEEDGDTPGQKPTAATNKAPAAAKAGLMEHVSRKTGKPKRTKDVRTLAFFELPKGPDVCALVCDFCDKGTPIHRNQYDEEMMALAAAAQGHRFGNIAVVTNKEGQQLVDKTLEQPLVRRCYAYKNFKKHLKDCCLATKINTSPDLLSQYEADPTMIYTLYSPIYRRRKEKSETAKMNHKARAKMQHHSK